METKKIKIGQHNLKFGLILGGISVIYNLMLFFIDAHIERSTLNNIVNFVITAGVIVWAIIEFRKENGGFLSLSESLKIGLGITLVSAIIAIIYTILLVKVLDPTYFEKSLEIAKNNMIENSPNLSQEEITRNLSFARKFMGIGAISIFIIVFSLLFGFVISLITGLIVKKSNPTEE